MDLGHSNSLIWMRLPLMRCCSGQTWTVKFKVRKIPYRFSTILEKHGDVWTQTKRHRHMRRHSTTCCTLLMQLLQSYWSCMFAPCKPCQGQRQKCISKLNLQLLSKNQTALMCVCVCVWVSMSFNNYRVIQWKTFHSLILCNFPQLNAQ